MAIKGILFDLYGTLIDIETDESMEEIYRGISHYLTYHGSSLHRWEVRDRYYAAMRRQKERSGEEFPEIDVEAIWHDVLTQEGIGEPAGRRAHATTLAQMYRGLSRKRLQLYPNVKSVLDQVRLGYRVGLISDAQPCYAIPEIGFVGLAGYFDPIIISGHFGYRKPDPRLTQKALDALSLAPSEVIYVGNDMYRDIFGANRLGIKTIFVDSNQGAKSHFDSSPGYFAHRFEEVPNGIRALA
jgi:putative hydrolase of the HAD superfamily